ncbi:putative ABC transporter ATP-binding protein YbhF [Novipirellula aureliae]|uniref:Putative ABC transporter ATP-binding protein YbhF n=1 Tax=Novipirellula aureliae TaxID=2527966 RepID=A0A5C6DEW4_9BACT|nr:ATP-binding cassette domain-containing protein [Novipirellula aureliae]TWU35222.1 putative ABC transporter ATP-binding protein YbhF [Novipirellula aureliae]
MNLSDTSNDVALHLDRVIKRFHAGKRTVLALDDVSLHIATGKITGLIGPDGAGKTTLMRLAAGLLKADSGTVDVLGLDATRQALQVQATVGYMPQRFGLYEDLTVQENLDLYSDLQGVPVRARAARYDELMRMTGLEPFTKRLAGKLSGGMKQKLGLACTLIHPPRLLLLDEPTVGVDPVSRRELWSIVNRFVQEEGTTVLMSTAYLDEAERCHEVIILNEGKLIGHGPPNQFSVPMAGRVFKVRVAGRKNRDIQELLSPQTDVTDAVIQGDAVRLVLAPGIEPTAASLLPGENEVSIDAVPSRFEDGFISMLRQQRSENRQSRTRTIDEVGLVTAFHPQERVIEVHDVERRFGNFFAVKNVSFDVKRGEVFGLLGANGAGKTTMFRMLCGLLPASGGSMRVAGVDVRKTAAAARARIGYMSQKFSLYGKLSVNDNLQFFSSAYGLSGRRRRDRIDWATAEFDLGEVADDNSGELPLGFKQRLALACALMHGPEIVFLDEPTSGVDPLARREFWHRINTLAARGITIMVTTHFMEEAEYCDRIAILLAGEVLSLDTPNEIKRQARSKEHPEPTMEDAFVKLIDLRSPSPE